MAAHTYWRMWMPLAYARSATYLRAYEMEWRATSGGADLSGPATKYASGGVVAVLFDDDAGSLWESLEYAFSRDNWVKLQFSTPVDVREVVWNSYAAGNTPTQFDMQSSDDGVNWTTEWSGADAAGWVGEKTFTAPAPPVITFGGIEGTNVEIIDANTIDVDAPAHAAGAVDVVLTRPESAAPATAVNGYTYDQTITAPDITSVTPDPAKASGGETMSVIGVRMNEGCVVRLAGREFSKYRNEIVNGAMAAPGAPWTANAGEAPLVTWENGVANLFVRRHPDPGSVVLRYVGGQLSQTVNVPAQGNVDIGVVLGGAVGAATPVQVWFGGQLLATLTTAGLHTVRTIGTPGPRTLMFSVTGEVADAQVTVNDVSVKVASSSEIVVNGAMDGSTGWQGGTSSPGGTIVSWTLTPGAARLYARSWLDPETHLKDWYYGSIGQDLVVPEGCNGMLRFTLAGMAAGESVSVSVGNPVAPLHLASYTGDGEKSAQITFPAGGTYPIFFEFYSAKSGDYGIITNVSLIITPTDNDIVVNGDLDDGTGWTAYTPAPATNGVTFAGGVANLFVRSYPDPNLVAYIYERGAVSQDFTTEASGASRVRFTAAGVTAARPALVELDGAAIGVLYASGNHEIVIPNLIAGPHTLRLSVLGDVFDTSISIDNVALEAPPPWMIEWVSPELLRFTTPQMPLGPQVLRVTNPNGEFDEYVINVESGIVWQTGRRRTVGHVNFH